MSELRFNCPNCGQQLSTDSAYAGQRVTCPTCNTQAVIPPPAPGAGSAPSMPPLPGAQPQYAPAPAQKTSGLAIASLICSIGSFIIIPLGFIPGIICGHMAKRDLNRTPNLQGRGLAMAGLIVGYISLAMHVIAVIVLVGFIAFAATRLHSGVSGSGFPPSHPGPRGHAVPAEPETTDTQPDGSGWTLQLADAETPAAPAAGRIHGQAFKVDKVKLEAGWLKLIEGQNFMPDREMDVVLFESDPTKLSGRTFTVPRQDSGITPHIYLHWKDPANNASRIRSFVQHYALRLEFGELADNKLPAKIYLCTPDMEKSFVAGTFDVPVKAQR